MDNKTRRESTFAHKKQMEAPLTWEAPPYCEIIDLKENYYEEVLRLIKHHYLKEDPMCRSVNLLKDHESKQQYLDLIKIWMKDSTSLIAISKSSGRVIGTIIARINSLLDKTNTYSRVQIFQGKALELIMSLKSALVLQADAYSLFEVDKYLRIYILCVHPSYENNDLGAELLFSSYQVAMSLQLVAIAGIFTSAKNQKTASRVGFKKVTEIKYSTWIVNEEIVFNNSGIGNYSAAFMGKITPDENCQEEILESRRRFWEQEEENKKKHKTKNRNNCGNFLYVTTFHRKTDFFSSDYVLSGMTPPKHFRCDAIQ
ncbi:uncharacterized protein LOC117170071 [Belonocnema kinseyi]|uniref:uncharacterized protein LOC117170071 n=1 Tax=Belonocnema kinseyi TaxID=2817044 RepID=UPI00143DE159|nr:uncharacterized protein LOC117170071 [Belonocnema kinseyi]